MKIHKHEFSHGKVPLALWCDPLVTTAPYIMPCKYHLEAIGLQG